MATFELAEISYGRDEEGETRAIVKFYISDEEFEDFTVDVLVRDTGDPTANVMRARKAFQRMTAELAALAALPPD